MATSLQYNFPYTDADLIIRDAFERCGILNYSVDALRYQSARSSLNYLLQQWMNKGFNLFTLNLGLIQIIPGQSTYQLPPNTLKLLQCKMSSANRITGGTASSSAGGTPSVCFTTTVTGSCVQISPNGNISYLYPQNQSITYVGILTGATNIYKLSFDCSYLSTPAESDWITMLNTPAVNYYTGETLWYQLPQTRNAVNWRVRETGGATLNLSQIYFDIPYKSVPMRAEGNDLYFQQPTQNQTGTTSQYWVNRIPLPTLNVWPYPDSTYQFYAYESLRNIQDVGEFFNSLDTVAAFIEPATAELAARLAQKFAPDRYADLRQAADTVFLEAGKTNTENVNSQFTFGMNQA